MGEEAISGANIITADTFSHKSNTQKENTNSIFTSEKLDKLKELADAVKYLTTNESKYYVSNSANSSDTQGNLTCNVKTVTHTNNEKEMVTYTSNDNFEQKSLSNRTLTVFVLMFKSRIDYMIAPIGADSQALLTPTTKEAVMDTVSGDTWVN